MTVNQKNFLLAGVLLAFLLIPACQKTQPLVNLTPETVSNSDQPTQVTKTAFVASLPTSTPIGRILTDADKLTFEQNQRLGRAITFILTDEEGQSNGFGALPETRYFEAIEQAGFNSVLLPIDWSIFTDMDAPYQISQEGFDYVDEIIDRLMDLDLGVALYFAGDEELQDSPRVHKDRFLSMWEQVANHYKRYPDSLYFGLYFNPQGTLGATSWNEFANLAINEIRKTNPERTIIVQAGSFNPQEMITFELPEDDRGLIVSFFYFSPFQFTFQGMAQNPQGEGTEKVTWTGNDDEMKILQESMAFAQNYSGSSGRPTNIVAFTCSDGADPVSRNLWISSVARAAEEVGISWSYLAFFMDPFSAYDIDNDAWDQNILQALIP
jgi:endoglucanase